MRVTVDRVGRIVVPKAVRESLGIGPGTELELQSDGAGLRLDPVAPAERVIEHADGLPLLGPVPGAVLRDADVARIRDELGR